MDERQRAWFTPAAAAQAVVEPELKALLLSSDAGTRSYCRSLKRCETWPLPGRWYRWLRRAASALFRGEPDALPSPEMLR